MLSLVAVSLDGVDNVILYQYSDNRLAVLSWFWSNLHDNYEQVYVSFTEEGIKGRWKSIRNACSREEAVGNGGEEEEGVKTTTRRTGRGTARERSASHTNFTRDFCFWGRIFGKALTPKLQSKRRQQATAAALQEEDSEKLFLLSMVNQLKSCKDVKLKFMMTLMEGSQQARHEAQQQQQPQQQQPQQPRQQTSSHRYQPPYTSHGYFNLL